MKIKLDKLIKNILIRNTAKQEKKSFFDLLKNTYMSFSRLFQSGCNNRKNAQECFNLRPGLLWFF